MTKGDLSRTCPIHGVVAEDRRAELLREPLARDDETLPAARAAADAVALRCEAETLAVDPVDLEEARRVRQEMNELAADWPED